MTEEKQQPEFDLAATLALAWLKNQNTCASITDVLSLISSLETTARKHVAFHPRRGGLDECGIELVAEYVIL
jgi:hypothetical protein